MKYTYNYRVSISDTSSTGPFAIYLEGYNFDYLLHRDDIPLQELLEGISIYTDVKVKNVKIVNKAPCCNYEVIIPFEGITGTRPDPTPTPTPTTSQFIDVPQTCKLYRLINPWIESQEVTVTLCGATESSKVYAVASTPYFVCSSTYPIVAESPNGSEEARVQVTIFNNDGCANTVSPTPTPTPTKTPIATPSPTPGLTPSPTPQPTQSASGGIPQCSTIGRPPTIASVFTATESQTGFQFDADNVPRFWTRLKSGSTVVRQTEMVYAPVATAADIALANAAVATPLVQLFTNNNPVFKYETVDSGTYTLEIEGSSCRSTPSTRTVTITGTALGFTAGYPSYQRTGNTVTLSIKVDKAGTFNTRVYNNTTSQEVYNAPFAYNANNVLTIPNAPLGNYLFNVGSISTSQTISADDISPKVMSSSLKEHIDIVWSGSSGNWIANDVSNVNVEPGFELCYRAGGKIIRGERLSNFIWQTNNPIRIVKCMVNKSYPNTSAWGKGEATDDNNAARSFTRNVSYAFSSAIFKS